jgi:hypothetical protein
MLEVLNHFTHTPTAPMCSLMMGQTAQSLHVGDLLELKKQEEAN